METLAPTPERLARNQWDAPEVNRQTERRAYRVLSLVETMHRLGSIDSEQLAAWKRYAWDVEQAHRYTPGVGSYGDRRGGGSGELDPLDYKLIYHRRMEAAEAAISRELVRRVVRVLARNEMTLTELAAQFGRSPRRFGHILREGISDLHRHYTGPPQR